MSFLESLPLLALALSALGLFLGGLVKGVVGIGLPLVAVPLIALVFPVPTAVAALALPILGSNFWQLCQGAGPLPALKRFWLPILPLVGGILLGAQLLVSLDEQRLNVVLGSLLLAFVLLQFLPLKLKVPKRREKAVDLLVGATAGLTGGLSSFYGPPLVMYLLLLKLPKEVFIPSIGTLYFIGGGTLYLALAAYDFLPWQILLASLAGLLPVYAGMDLGRRLRARLNEKIFFRAVLAVLAMIGGALIFRALG
jgi:uncharacterized membrane protein YfcA